MSDAPFTQAALSKLAALQGERRVVHDPKTSGLRAELREGGGLSFYFVRRLPGGGPVRVRIGKFPETTVDDARDAAAELNAQVRRGENPQIDRRRRREEGTLGELFEHWMQHHAKPHKKSWPEDQRQYDAYVATWKGRKLSTISKNDVLQLHSRMGKENGIYQANRVLALLRSVFNKADEVGFAGGNPAAGIKPFKEQSRKRYLQPDELPRFFQALDEEPSDTIRDFFLLCLFTGARRGNVCAMRWADVDFERSHWLIPETKAGEQQDVPLVGPALEILRRRKETANGHEWVLPGRHLGQHLKDPMKSWRAVCKRAGIENLRIHDLRRTLGSYAAIGGSSLVIIGKMLGHSRPETTQVYARLSQTAIADTMEATTSVILKTAKPKMKVLKAVK